MILSASAQGVGCPGTWLVATMHRKCCIRASSCKASVAEQQSLVKHTDERHVNS